MPNLIGGHYTIKTNKKSNPMNQTNILFKIMVLNAIVITLATCKNEPSKNSMIDYSKLVEEVKAEGKINECDLYNVLQHYCDTAKVVIHYSKNVSGSHYFAITSSDNKYTWIFKPERYILSGDSNSIMNYNNKH